MNTKLEAALNEIEKPDLSAVTKHTDQTTGSVMLHQFAHGVATEVERGTPPAAVFAQGVSVLRPDVQEFAGSTARHEWLDRMKAIEDENIGPIRGWVSRITNKTLHPVLEKSIEFIESLGDRASISVCMLLADMYSAVGDQEKAVSTYSAALREHRRSGSSVPLTE